MMIRLIFSLMIGLTFGNAIFAQERSPYEIALQRIEEVRLSGGSHLDLSGLGLEEFPPEIGSLWQLQELSLQRNYLSEIGSEIGGLRNLLVLNLDSNELHSLPSEFGNLSSLTELHLASNQFATLPSEIGNLSSLVILNLALNELHSLPPEIGKLSNLRYFDLAMNQLINLPPEIGNLITICVIGLQYNYLWQLPQELWQLQETLTWERCGAGAGLYLDYNPLIFPVPEGIGLYHTSIWEFFSYELRWRLKDINLGIIAIPTMMILAIRWNVLRGKKKGSVAKTKKF